MSFLGAAGRNVETGGRPSTWFPPGTRRAKQRHEEQPCWLAACLPGWLAGWLARAVSGWLAGSGWLLGAGWVAGWLTSERLPAWAGSLRLVFHSHCRLAVHLSAICLRGYALVGSLHISVSLCFLLMTLSLSAVSRDSLFSWLYLHFSENLEKFSCQLF